MRLFNAATKSLQTLPPAPAHIGMYFCGPTVYARAHVGNARPFVLGMWLRAWLRSRGYGVTLVHNITDINDKIYAAAPGASAALAERATDWYLQDVAALGLGLPDELPKASNYVPAIVDFIQKLIDAGAAYAAEGDVYFRVGRAADYGCLSGRTQAEPEEGPANPAKEDPRDFALWKATKPGEDTFWQASWGRGRPGWHIECSVMAEQLLGHSFEIHGGGVDLLFPHHENELAQSRALGREFARIWVHNGMLRSTGAKMSKSAGELVTLREALDRWGAESLLLFLLGGHFRRPIDFSEQSMEQAGARAEGLREAFAQERAPRDEAQWQALVEVLDDDFNTPEALAILHRWADGGQLDLLERALGIFGLSSLAEPVRAPGLVEQLARERQRARERQDFDAADRLRSAIEAAGWQVRDEAGGFRLTPVRVGKAGDRRYLS
ncbi:MAG: cysteine--tRNA ligase [Myxococcales bacterium]|nr:cysteine--tRNA ligase [Myxococcales bacterium]